MQKKDAYINIKTYLLVLLLLVIFGYEMKISYQLVLAAETGVVVTMGGSLRVRNAPNGETVGSVPKGTEVIILEEQDGWYKIEFEEGCGYVSADYVEKVTEDEEYKKQLLQAGFPESYCAALMKLHEDYPNWEFEAWDTGLDWQEAVEAECAVGKNTVSGNAISSYKSISKGAYNLKTNTWVSFDSGGWVSASEEIVSYYMDSRNFLDSYYIFQFMDQTYNGEKQTEKGLTTVVENTFLNTKEYKKNLMEAAQKSGVSPYVLASMIIVEQGYKGTGKSISGTQAGYEGYYNFYNIGAYATKTMTAVQRGLWYAMGGSSKGTSYNRPWNSKKKAVVGGAVYYGNNYVAKGQTTLYLKKFNVQGDEKYSHQYMTNVQAAAAEAFQVAKAYNKITDGKINFKIPLFRNMPEESTQKPKGTGNPVNYLNGIKVEGYEFAPVFQIYQQKYSLIVENKVKKVNISAEAYTNKAEVSGDIGEISLKKGMNKAEITVTAQNGLERVYTIYIFRGNSEDADFENAEEALSTLTPEPTKEGEVTPTEVGELTPTKEAEVTPDQETQVTPTKKVEITPTKKPKVTPTKKPKVTPTKGVEGVPTKEPEENLKETVKGSGDVNGDGKISVMDLLKVRKAILGNSQLTDEEKTRADVNGNGKIDIIDLLRVQKSILGVE